LAALLAMASLAGHPRVDLEPRPATLTEKHDAHRALPFPRDRASVALRSAPVSEHDERDPQQEQGPEDHTLVELRHQPEVQRGKQERLAEPGDPRRDTHRLGDSDLPGRPGEVLPAHE